MWLCSAPVFSFLLLHIVRWGSQAESLGYNVTKINMVEWTV